MTHPQVISNICISKNFQCSSIRKIWTGDDSTDRQKTEGRTDKMIGILPPPPPLEKTFVCGGYKYYKFSILYPNLNICTLYMYVYMYNKTASFLKCLIISLMA